MDLEITSQPCFLGLYVKCEYMVTAYKREQDKKGKKPS